MPSESEVTLDQIRDILEMLRRTIEGAADLARRIEVLEKASVETFRVVESLQANQQKLLEAFDKRSEAQTRLDMDITRAIGELSERLDLLSGKGQVM